MMKILKDNILVILLIIIIMVLVISLIIVFIKYYSKPELNWTTSMVYLAGFEYDPKQNIFVTRKDALQRIGGYNDLYDRLSTLLYMVIDIEPIEYQFNGKWRMIELWKGQYYASTGSEIGYYHEVAGKNKLWECASDDELIQMEYSLKNKKGETIFHRSGKHWWLTGFRPGCYNDPVDLIMDNIKITFNSEVEAKAFFTALQKLINTYKGDQDDYKPIRKGTEVSFRWGKTLQSQPNKALRPDALRYDQNLAKYVNLLLRDQYDTDNINKVFIQIKSFLENDGNFYEVTSFYTDKNNNLEERAKEWDKKNGTQITVVYELMKSIKPRVDLFFAMLKILGKVCKLPLLPNDVKTACQLIKPN